MSAAVDVLVFDEPEAVNPAFRATLEHMPTLHTVGEADLDALDPGPVVALVFLDERRLPDGLARLVALKERRPALRVLVAFQALAGADLRALLEAGADGVVARSASARELCEAVLALAEGAAILAAPAPGIDAGAPAGDGLGLTPREAEILRFLSAGFSNKEVARRLTLSVRTVETHRLNLRRKTKTGRLKDLVALARELGLAPVVEPDPMRRGADRPSDARAAPARCEGPARH